MNELILQDKIETKKNFQFERWSILGLVAISLLLILFTIAFVVIRNRLIISHIESVGGKVSLVIGSKTSSLGDIVTGKLSSFEWFFLRSFGRVKSVSFDYKTLGTSSLADLKDSSELTYLQISHCIVPDEAFSNLKEIDHLDWLVLFNVDVTDACMKHIGDTKSLKKLSVCKTKITDEGLMYLKGYTKIEALFLGVNDISDSGLSNLSSLVNLKWLGLSETKVTDAGLFFLKGMTNLERLNLGKTEITDSGLMHLTYLSHLRHVDLQGAKVTQAGIDKLQKALPACNIIWTSPTTKPASP